MSLTLDDNQAAYQIRAYKPGQIQVNQQVYTQSIIVMPNQLIENWSPQHISELKQADFQIIQELRPTILIIGTGKDLVFPELEVYGHLINASIGVEIMDTSAACRTYNILTAENRKIAAALIIQ